MIVETESVTINAIPEQRRYEISVVTALGETIEFPNAQLEIRHGEPGANAAKTLYFFATKKEFTPVPRSITFFIEVPEGGDERSSLDITPIDDEPDL